MKSKRSLMTALIGLAMLATPITAAAQDHDHYAQDNSHAARVSRSFSAPARNVGRADVTRHEVHNNSVPAVTGRRGLSTVEEYRNYGRNYRYPGYYRAPSYAVPAYPVRAPYYGAPGYAVANPCRQAQSIVNNYYRDRNTGHPAAAADILARNQWAFRSGCGGASPYAGGLLGGFGAAPVYNGGYGQPYGGSSMLGPLIQQFVR